MDLVLLLLLVLVVFAIVGGLAIHPLVFLVLIVAVLLFVGSGRYRSPR